ncbi:hypothetical protein HK096_005304, partial [Nowakowskiella sp. JEL0078]
MGLFAVDDTKDDVESVPLWNAVGKKKEFESYEWICPEYLDLNFYLSDEIAKILESVLLLVFRFPAKDFTLSGLSNLSEFKKNPQLMIPKIPNIHGWGVPRNEKLRKKVKSKSERTISESDEDPAEQKTESDSDDDPETTIATENPAHNPERALRQNELSKLEEVLHKEKIYFPKGERFWEKKDRRDTFNRAIIDMQIKYGVKAVVNYEKVTITHSSISPVKTFTSRE